MKKYLLEVAAIASAQMESSDATIIAQSTAAQSGKCQKTTKKAAVIAKKVTGVK